MSGKKSNRDQETPTKTQVKKPAVLSAFQMCASVTRACTMAGISRDTFYRWLKQDVAFKEAC